MKNPFEKIPSSQLASEEKTEGKEKEDPRIELLEKFGIKDTAGFTSLLQEGNIEKAEEFFNYILENIEKFPMYHGNQRWVSDRKKELEYYKSKKEKGDLKEISKRTKIEAQNELQEKFGLKDTTAFRTAIEKGEIKLCEQWLEYIKNNKELFPQYIPNWEKWYSDRIKEIEVAKKVN